MIECQVLMPDISHVLLEYSLVIVLLYFSYVPPYIPKCYVVLKGNICNINDIKNLSIPCSYYVCIMLVNLM